MCHVKPVTIIGALEYLLEWHVIRLLNLSRA